MRSPVTLVRDDNLLFSLKYRMTVWMHHTTGDRAGPPLYAGSPPLSTTLFEVQYEKFKLVSQNPGESVHAYNFHWNLERDLVDELRMKSKENEVKLDNDQIIASELRKLQSPRATTRTSPWKSFPFSPQPRNFQRITHLGVDSRFSELEDETVAQSPCCQDLSFKFQTDGKINWWTGQMKHLWSQFAKLISGDRPDDDDSIPENDEVRSYLQGVESGYLN